MKAKVLFENTAVRCRLVLVHESGNVEPGTAVRPVDYEEHHDFDSVSELVGYCLEQHIEVAIGDCMSWQTVNHERDGQHDR